MPKYYSLIAISHDNRANIEFGAYSKTEVRNEQQDLRNSATFSEFYKATTILTHDDDYQATIQADVNDFERRYAQSQTNSKTNS